MKSTYLVAILVALGTTACSKETPPPAPTPKVEAPRPPEAPVAAPASADAPKADAAPATPPVDPAKDKSKY
ncbi:MAG TPA: hypothetical protein VGI57_04610 [Usitatibacter sp.]|jgi:hypothetical protein